MTWVYPKDCAFSEYACDCPLCRRLAARDEKISKAESFMWAVFRKHLVYGVVIVPMENTIASGFLLSPRAFFQCVPTFATALSMRSRTVFFSPGKTLDLSSRDLIFDMEVYATLSPRSGYASLERILPMGQANRPYRCRIVHFLCPDDGAKTKSSGTPAEKRYCGHNQGKPGEPQRFSETFLLLRNICAMIDRAFTDRGSSACVTWQSTFARPC